MFLQAGAQSASVFSSQIIYQGVIFFNGNNPANAATSDNIRAIATDTLTLLVGRTGYLKAKGFGFGLSSYAGVCGIEVQIEKSASNILGLATVQDYEVKLLKNDVAVGNNKASGTNWTNSDSYYTYGGSNDLLGNFSWSLSDINSANFGVVISAQINGVVGILPIARIDHIRLTVYYNIILPLHLISFETKANNGNVNLYWEVEENNDNARYIIQRSEDGATWGDIGELASQSQAAALYKYHFVDRQPLQEALYRLKIYIGLDQIKYSSTQKVKVQRSDSFAILPNPAKDKIVITNFPGFPAEIRIYDLSGKLVIRHYYREQAASLDISLLKPGLYNAVVTSTKIDQVSSMFVKSQ